VQAGADPVEVVGLRGAARVRPSSTMAIEVRARTRAVVGPTMRTGARPAVVDGHAMTGRIGPSSGVPSRHFDDAIDVQRRFHEGAARANDLAVIALAICAGWVWSQAVYRLRSTTKPQQH